MIRHMLIALLLVAAPIEAIADVAAGFMAVRHRGCADRPGVTAPLHRNRKLDAMSKLIADGAKVREAGQKIGYKEKSAAAFRIPGVPDDGLIERALIRQFCSQVTDPEYTEIGTYRRGPVIWAVMALPMIPPSPREADAIARRILELTNAARSSDRQCGREPFGAVPPLILSPALSSVAMIHSRDMAAHDLFDHIGSDGSSPGDRVTRSGYKWRMVGENLASGITGADAVMSGWLDSPHHCENIMGPRFSEMGIAYFFDPKSADGIYWTQVFGTPAR